MGQMYGGGDTLFAMKNKLEISLRYFLRYGILQGKKDTGQLQAHITEVQLVPWLLMILQSYGASIISKDG